MMRTNDMNRETWIQTALNCGFDIALPLEIGTLNPRLDIRDMCAADKCRAYGKNWTCPPHCGTLAECEAKIKRCSWGILLQTVGQMEKAIDSKAYRRTEDEFLSSFHAFCKALRKEYPDALCLGAGGCRICPKCAWPDPCRFPEKARSSMEGYGLFVTDVCRKNGAEYYHGEGTITYTGCVLW